MNPLFISFDSKENILFSLERIANKFANDFQIRVNDAWYRVTEFEFYLYSDKFPDPHTYKHRLQLQPGKFYLHASGVDITCGSETNYGGILLRQVIRLGEGSDSSTGFMKEEISGPQNVATELFSNLHPLDSNKPNSIELIDLQGNNQDALMPLVKKLIKTKRFGLTPKKDDPTDEFLNMNIRYIVIVDKFKQKIKGIESIVGEMVLKGEMDLDEARNILGYHRNFQ